MVLEKNCRRPFIFLAAVFARVIHQQQRPTNQQHIVFDDVHQAVFFLVFAKLPDLLRTLSTPEGSAAYGLLLAPAQGEAAAQLIERYAVAD